METLARFLSGMQLEELGHFLMKEASSRMIGLDPFAVHDKLRDRSFAYVTDNFVCRPRVGLDIDLGIRDMVLFKEALGLTAIAAPGCGVEKDLHGIHRIATEGWLG